MEYLFTQGDRYLNEVLEERRLKRAQSSSPQTPLPSAAQEYSNYSTPTNLPKTEEAPQQEHENSQPHSNTEALKKETSALHKAMQSNSETNHQAAEQNDEKAKNEDNNNEKNESDFYNHPEIQEKAIRNLMDIFLYRLRNHLHYEGTPIAGKKDNFNITIRGMLAASHRVGQEYVKRYLNLLEKDKNGRYYFPYNKISERDKEKYELVETRLRLFAD